MDIETLLVALAKSFEKSGVRALLVGGLALGAHGVQRYTMDIDFLVPDSELNRIRGVMAELGLKMKFRNELFARFQGSDTPFVDTLTVADTTFEKAWRESIPHLAGDVNVQCASILTLVAMKLHALRHGRPEREPKDYLDILSLLKAGGVAIDSEEFKSLCLKYAGEAVLKRFLDELANQMNKG